VRRDELTRFNPLEYFNRLPVGASDFDLLYGVGAGGDWRSCEYLDGLAGTDAVRELRSGGNLSDNPERGWRSSDIC
jgi:hypothetical protein